MHLVEGNATALRAPSWTLSLGDAAELMREIPSGSIDAIISDPPYPEIDRDYGRFSVEEWFTLMGRVVAEARRILRPTGSAVFIIQPNHERIGRMAPWSYRWQADLAESWNIIQDVHWWNHTALPAGCSTRGGLLRPSVKSCVWLGPPTCNRYQDEVLWDEADASKANRLAARARRSTRPSGHSVNDVTAYAAAVRRGGVTPFNCLPIASVGDVRPGEGHVKHPAMTPPELVRFWVRYLTRPGDLVADPFAGSGTVGAEAIELGRSFWGSECVEDYYRLASARLSRASEAWDHAA